MKLFDVFLRQWLLSSSFVIDEYDGILSNDFVGFGISTCKTVCLIVTIAHVCISPNLLLHSLDYEIIWSKTQDYTIHWKIKNKLMFQLFNISVNCTLRQSRTDSLIVYFFKGILHVEGLCSRQPWYFVIFCSMLRLLRFFFKGYVVFKEKDWGSMNYASRMVQISVSVFFQYGA